MVSPAAVQSWGPEFGQHPVGTGPFRFDTWAAGDRIILRRNPNYGWAPAGLRHHGPPYLEALTFRMWQKPLTRELLAEADLAQVLPRESDLRQLLADHRFRLRSDLVPGVPEGLAINATRPPCHERAVRRAIAHAVNAADIVRRVHKGRQTQAFGPLSPASSCYDPRVESQLRHNPERSRASLEEAGWLLRPGSSVRQKDGRSLSVSLFIHEGDEQLAEIVREHLARVGIEVHIDLRSDRARADACRLGEHHLANTGWMGNDPAVLDYVFQSTPNNTGVGWTHHGDGRLDDLLRRGRRELEGAKRRVIYADIQHHILEEAYFVPVYNVSSLLLIRDGVQGLLMDPRAYYVWLHGARKQPANARKGTPMSARSRRPGAHNHTGGRE
jgi:peptide/nickel transport system substrate-binding protein